MPEIASLYDWLRPTRRARIELDGQHVECRVYDELTGLSGYGTGVDLETAATAAVVDWQRNSAAEESESRMHALHAPQGKRVANEWIEREEATL